MGCYEEALDYAKQRIMFTKPIAGYQLVQNKLVEMVTETTKAQLLCLQLGRLKEQGQSTFVQVSLAKRNNVHQALEIARTARDILGANGILNEYSAMRHMPIWSRSTPTRDARHPHAHRGGLHHGHSCVSLGVGRGVCRQTIQCMMVAWTEIGPPDPWHAGCARGRACAA